MLGSVAVAQYADSSSEVYSSSVTIEHTVSLEEVVAAMGRMAGIVGVIDVEVVLTIVVGSAEVKTGTGVADVSEVGSAELLGDSNAGVASAASTVLEVVGSPEEEATEVYTTIGLADVDVSADTWTVILNRYNSNLRVIPSVHWHRIIIGFLQRRPSPVLPTPLTLATANPSTVAVGSPQGQYVSVTQIASSPSELIGIAPPLIAPRTSGARLSGKGEVVSSW